MVANCINDVRMGGRVLLSSNTFLIPKGEICEFSLRVEHDSFSKDNVLTFPIRILFEEDGGANQSVSFKPDPVTHSMKMTLHNWNNPLGTALKEFYPIVNIQDKTIIEMLMVNKRVGDVNELSVQFWRKEVDL